MKNNETINETFPTLSLMDHVETIDKTIDLNALGSMLLENEKLLEKVKKTGKMLVTGKALIPLDSIYKELESLPLLSIEKSKDNDSFLIKIIKLYRDEEKPVFCLPDNLNSECKELTLETFRTGKQSFALARYKGTNILLKCAFANSKEHLIELETKDILLEGIEGSTSSELDVEYLSDRPETMLKYLNLGNYEITKIGKKSKYKGVVLIDLKDDKGNSYSSIICNSWLEKYADQVGKKFKIKEKIEIPSKDKKDPKKMINVICVAIDDNGKDVSQVNLNI